MYIPQYDIYKGITGLLSFISAVTFIPPFEAFVFSNKDSWRLHIILLFLGLSLFYFVSIFGLRVIE